MVDKNTKNENKEKWSKRRSPREIEKSAAKEGFDPFQFAYKKG